MNNNKPKKPKKQNVEIAPNLSRCNGLTHDGPFHGDDVAACVILSLVVSEVSLIRTRDYATICEKRADKNTTIFDVGGRYDPELGHFDHHQSSFKLERDDGIPYASAGLLWRYYGEDILRYFFECPEHLIKAVYERVDRTVLKGIDARDYGLEPNGYSLSFSGIISLFNALPGSSENSDHQFIQAVEIAKKIFKRAVLHAIAAEQDGEQVRKIVDGITDNTTEILVLPREYIGWPNQIICMETDAAKRLKFVVFYDSQLDQYLAKAIPLDMSIIRDDEKLYRQYFPDEWLSLNQRRLVKLTGVETAAYCNKEGKYVVAKTEEGAIQLAKLALSWESKPTES